MGLEFGHKTHGCGVPFGTAFRFVQPWMNQGAKRPARPVSLFPGVKLRSDESQGDTQCAGACDRVLWGARQRAQRGVSSPAYPDGESTTVTGAERRGGRRPPVGWYFSHCEKKGGEAPPAALPGASRRGPGALGEEHPQHPRQRVIRLAEGQVCAPPGAPFCGSCLTAEPVRRHLTCPTPRRLILLLPRRAHVYLTTPRRSQGG